MQRFNYSPSGMIEEDGAEYVYYYDYAVMILDRIDKNMDMPPKNKTENKREKIKRYNPQMLHTGYTIDQIEMAAKPDGQYVLYEDHQKIIAELKEELTDKQN